MELSFLELGKVQSMMNDAEKNPKFVELPLWQTVKDILEAGRPAALRAIELEELNERDLVDKIKQIAVFYKSDVRYIPYEDYLVDFHSHMFDSLNSLSSSTGSEPNLKTRKQRFRAASAIAAVATTMPERAWIGQNLSRVVEALAPLEPGVDIESDKFA